MQPAVIGSHANAWNAALTGAGGFSNIIGIGSCMFVSAFGTSDGAATITLQYSMNGTTFYSGPTQVLSGSGDFRIDAICAAKHVRLKSSADVTATATIAAKR